MAASKSTPPKSQRRTASTPVSNPIKLAQNVASHYFQNRSPEELGKIARTFKDVADAFKHAGEKKRARELEAYAAGFNRAAARRA